MANWKVAQLRVVSQLDNREDVVIAVTWQIDDLRGVTDLELAGDSFTAFKDLSEAQVLDWVWAKIPKEQWEVKAAELAAQPKPIESVSKPLPWG